MSEIIDLSKEDPNITIICFNCPNGIEPKMKWITFDPDNYTHRFKCPKCGNIILIWKNYKENEVEDDE